MNAQSKASAKNNLGIEVQCRPAHVAEAIVKNQKSSCKYIAGCFYYFVNGEIANIKKDAINPNKPVIALTFDDGPGKHTERLLKQLEKYDARATFFMVGTNAEKYPKVIQHMQEIGCELGNHTTNHANLTKLTPDEIRTEIAQTDEAIIAAVGSGASLIRPPYGAVNDVVKSEADRPLVMWSIDTMDWNRENADEITKYVLKYVKDGDIVLMHDIHKISVDSAVEFIPKLIKKGYQFVTVSELAAYKGIDLENGIQYFEFNKGPE